jgi:biopolymer transport protein ExbD
MKIKGAKQVHYDSGPNMTPLVDVVMVILIFLMLAGSFGANSWYLTSNLPIKGAGGPPKEPVAGELPDEIVEIKIFGEGTGFRVMGDNINSQGIVPTRDWLVERLTAKKALLASQNTKEDQIQVVLAPTASARYEHIALVYEAALKAQFKKVAFRTSQ